MTQIRGITDWDRMESYNKLLKFSDTRTQLGSKQIALNYMKHSELGDTYLTLLEAIEQTGLSEAEVVLHSEELCLPRSSRWSTKVTFLHSALPSDTQQCGDTRRLPAKLLPA